jgi:hypothetical protein
MYDMKNWDMPGWAFGASYVYAWDAKPGRMAPPDIETTIRGGIGWRHTLQEVALLAIGFNPGPFDMKNWDMPGWAFGASYVYAWDAKPGRMASPDAY